MKKSILILIILLIAGIGFGQKVPIIIDGDTVYTTYKHFKVNDTVIERIECLDYGDFDVKIGAPQKIYVKDMLAEIEAWKAKIKRYEAILRELKFIK